jgi:hypothetical protein
LKLQYDELLANVAFDFNLRRCTTVDDVECELMVQAAIQLSAGAYTRPLFGSTQALCVG